MIGCAHRHMTHIARVRAPHLSGACVVCAVRIRGTPEEHPSPPLSDSPAPLSLYTRDALEGEAGGKRSPRVPEWTIATTLLHPSVPVARRARVLTL